ncbi:protein lutein deficient 5, chloroplastic [Tanacetum coccineum]
MSGPEGIVQATKMRKIAYGLEGKHEVVLPTHECIRKIIEDVSDDDDFTRGLWVSVVQYLNAEGAIPSGCLGDIKSFRKNEKLEKVVVVIKTCTPNVLGDLTVTLLLKDRSVLPKDTVMGDGTGVGGGGMLDQEKIIKLLKEEEGVEQELQLNGILCDEHEHQLRLDQEALIHTVEKESRAEQEWQEMLMQQQESDEKHEKQLLGLYLGDLSSVSQPRNDDVRILQNDSIESVQTAQEVHVGGNDVGPTYVPVDTSANNGPDIDVLTRRIEAGKCEDVMTAMTSVERIATMEAIKANNSAVVTYDHMGSNSAYGTNDSTPNVNNGLFNSIKEYLPKADNSFGEEQLPNEVTGSPSPDTYIVQSVSILKLVSYAGAAGASFVVPKRVHGIFQKNGAPKESEEEVELSMMKRSSYLVNMMMRGVTERMVGEEDVDFNEEYLNEDNPSILHSLLALEDNVSSKQLHDDLMTMFIAGYETVAAVLTWTFYLLSKDPMSCPSFKTSDRFPTIEDMKKLKYTTRVFNESLRLYPQPPVPICRSIEDDLLDKYPIKRSIYDNA